MLHYYAYYSVGGYKDMYLGNSGMEDVERTYYMPLLPKMKADARTANEKNRVAQLEKLVGIEILTAKDRKGLPLEADTLVTHGCYALIYTHLTGSKYIITIRDIKNTDSDENGRSIPFLLSILSDSLEDLPLMNRVAAFFCNNFKKVGEELSTIIHYDVEANGTCFELTKMNSYISGIKSEATVKFISGKSKTLVGGSGEIALLMLPNGVKKQYALNELHMNKSINMVVTDTSLINTDGRTVAGLKQINSGKIPAWAYVLMAIGAVGAAGVLAWIMAQQSKGI